MKQHAPAAERNRDPILAVLRELLPGPAPLRVLEIASGTGQHALHFATHLPHVHWQPTDVSAEARASVEAWREESGLPNLAPVQPLDVCERWLNERFDAIYCANMIHISPYETTPALLSGARTVLVPQGALVLYGPFRRQGQHTAPSNEGFDLSLRSRDPSWGVRDLEEVAELARERELDLERIVEMPANNLTVVFRRR
jgi:cyclopropane fatty-acyl-phospholipid synthase-like methyltransferase